MEEIFTILTRRYYLYAKSQGLTPEEVFQRDAEMCRGEDVFKNFIAWNRFQIGKWAQAQNTHSDWAVLYADECSDWISAQMGGDS